MSEARKIRRTQASDFTKGDRVRYVPTHAVGDATHPDCQDGVVSSINVSWVFVKYDNAEMKMTTGDEPYTAQATDPNDLHFLGNDNAQFRPDWTKKCMVCESTPIVPCTEMCGPCTFGEADTVGGNW